MVVMGLELNNFLLFDHFRISMSYPKKIVGSTIPSEHLSDRPYFRYKKLVVLMGANATGKTALGKILMAIFNFISRREYGWITGLIENKKREASFSIDLAFSSNILVRIIARIKLIIPVMILPSKSKLLVSTKTTHMRSALIRLKVTILQIMIIILRLLSQSLL